LAREKTELKTFNRGLVSPLALARTDLERVGISAETMDNWMPRNLGSMMLRPGKSYIGNTASDSVARLIPFVYAAEDTAILELTDSAMRVWLNDSVITRSSVSTTITLPNMDSGALTGWTDNDAGGGVSTGVGTGSPTVSYMELQGTGAGIAKRTQEVTVAAGDQAVEHGLLVEVGLLDPTANGYQTGLKARLRIGTTEGDDDLVPEVDLSSGQYHFAFTPNSSSFWIEFSNQAKGNAYVRTCDIESSGDLSITTLWTESDLPFVRYDQSADVIYVACKDIPPMKISRYSSDSKSWGVSVYETEDGPFNTINTGPVKLTPDSLATSANITADYDFWNTTDEGRLVKISSDGQTVTAASVAADDSWTDPIEVTGVSSDRIFTVTISGTWTTTAALQRSLTDPDGTATWVEVKTWTANTVETYDDGLDNQIAWYRIGFDTGWDTGSATFTLDYSLGSITGIGRIDNIASTTAAQVTILKDFGSTAAQQNWYLGAWSGTTGYPTAVSLFEGRLAWAGKNKTWLSESDAYEDFDDEAIGDAGPITRTIGGGAVDTINWMKDAERLLLGTDSEELSLRASREDEILTPTNARIKKFSTQGSATVQADEVDGSILFVQRGGDRLMEAAWGDSFEYITNDLTTFYPEAGDSPIRRIAVQRQPDTRVHCVRADGSVAILLNDKAEQISCWVTHSGGTVEDVVVLPGADGDGEDAVYYVVNRTVNSSTVRFLEKWSLESENQGGATNKNLDAHITGTVSGGTMSGLDHLEGETVAAWVNGVDAGTYVVTSGAITGVTTNGAACVGLAYTAQFKSAKIGMLTDKKNIKRLGVIMRNTHYQGLQYGPDFSSLYNLPKVKDGAATAADTVHPTFDEETFAFGGRWDSDSRLCLQAASPRPVTLLAAIVEYEE
jgi:hypothetical protein